MTAPNFDLLDTATFGDKRQIAPADIPPKVTELVKRMATTEQSVTIPTDDPNVKAQMRPYFAAAAELIGREARVWDATGDNDKIVGFRVSLGKGRRKPGTRVEKGNARPGDAAVGAE